MMNGIKLTEREQAIFMAGMKAGMEVGKRQMEEYIVEQYERGKPVAACGRVWFIKSDLDNLKDIISDIRTTWEEDNGREWKDGYAEQG